MLIFIAMITMVGFWLTVIVNLFVDIEFAISLLRLYLPVGLIFGIWSLIDGVRKIIKITGRRGHKKVRLKAAVKRNATNAILDLLKDVLLWSCFGLYFLAFWPSISVQKKREDQWNGPA